MVSWDKVKLLIDNVKAEEKAEVEIQFRKMREEMICMMSSGQVQGSPKLHEPIDISSTKGSCSINGAHQRDLFIWL